MTRPAHWPRYDDPPEDAPECPACGGDGCKACGGSGEATAAQLDAMDEADLDGAAGHALDVAQEREDLA